MFAEYSLPQAEGRRAATRMLAARRSSVAERPRFGNRISRRPAAGRSIPARVHLQALAEIFEVSQFTRRKRGWKSTLSLTQEKNFCCAAEALPGMRVFGSFHSAMTIASCVQT